MNLDYPRIRHDILAIASPITPLLGKIHVPWPRRITEADVDSFLASNPKPGCGLLTRKRLQLTNLPIPGEWKHFSMYIGTPYQLVVEAVWPKVRVRNIYEWMMGEDYVDAVRPLFANDDEGIQAAWEAFTMVGEPYDTLFEYNVDRRINRAVFCSEVGWLAYDNVFKRRGLSSPFTPRFTMGVATIVPTDYALAKDKWQSFWSRRRIKEGV